MLVAAAAGAQTRVDIVPSATIGSIYDNNLFAKSKGQAGQMLVLRPGFEGVLKSPRFDLASVFSFDAQHSNFQTLTMLDARRHANLDLHYRTTEANTIGFAALYDRTDTPGDVDFVTGVLGVRRQAHRLEITPSVSHRVWRRTFLNASYDLIDESLIENTTGRLHTVRSGLSHQYTERTTLMASYMGREFVDRFESSLSNTASSAVSV
jgi:hypothetical protein